MDDIKEIKNIIFGILSPEEIMNMSVCKIDTTKLTGPGSVYDDRMGGNAENNIPCVTCKQSPKECPGHFGHIEFNEYIINPLFYKNVVSFLRCFCLQCNRLLITEDEIILCDLFRYNNEHRFKKIMEKIEKVDICGHCQNPQPKITYTPSDNTISKVYKEKINIDENDYDENGENEKVVRKKDAKISIVLSIDEIKKTLDSILDEDVILCGFDPSRIHPRNFIISVFPVIPPCARPFVLTDGNICDDDLTNQLIEIIKANNVLKHTDDIIPDEKREAKCLKAYQTLKFRVSTFFNNSQGKAKHPTNGRAIKGLKERMTGKEGQIRNNLMGKRVEFSGRTVIGPDPTLKFGQMGLPIDIAKELTIPERVTSFNKEYLTKLVNNGKANFVMKNGGNTTNGVKDPKCPTAKCPTRINLKYAMHRKGTELLYGDIVIRGDTEIKVSNGNVILQTGDVIKRNGYILKPLQNDDVIIRKGKKINIDPNTFPQYGDKIERDGKIITLNDILFYPTKKSFNLNMGDVVHRHLIDGDIILLNRQPTLHKGSMLAKEIKVMQGKTFRMNLATTKTFNADFDGDEIDL